MVKMHGMMGNFDPDMSFEEFERIIREEVNADIDENSLRLSYYMNTYMHLLTEINNESRELVRRLFAWAQTEGVVLPDDVFASTISLVGMGLRLGSAHSNVTGFVEDRIVESTDMDEVIKRLLD